jgi:hypothetical protein
MHYHLKSGSILGVEIAADDRFSLEYNLKKIEPLTEESSDRDGFQLPVGAICKRLNSAGGSLK